MLLPHDSRFTAGCLALMSLTLAPCPGQVPNPTIISARIDSLAGQMTITGFAFSPNGAKPGVFFGGTGLAVTSFTQDTIVAALNVMDTGIYRLFVSNFVGPSAGFDVTVGPDGPPGKPGGFGATTVRTSFGTSSLDLGLVDNYANAEYRQEIPGLSQKIAITADSVLSVTTEGGIQTPEDTLGVRPTAQIWLYINGRAIEQLITGSLAGNQQLGWSLNTTYTAHAGDSVSIAVLADRVSFPRQTSPFPAAFSEPRLQMFVSGSAQQNALLRGRLMTAIYQTFPPGQ
jgi:hypothetical protein